MKRQHTNKRQTDRQTYRNRETDRERQTERDRDSHKERQRQRWPHYFVMLLNFSLNVCNKINQKKPASIQALLYEFTNF